MPQRSGGAGSGTFARGANQDDDDGIPTAQVERMDTDGNDGLFRALHLHRRTAIRHLIERIEAGDHYVIRMVGFEFSDALQRLRREPLRIPRNLFDVVGRARIPEAIEGLLGDPLFQRLLVWYLRQEYINGDAVPNYGLSGGVFIALAHVHRIELAVYETNNDSVARLVFQHLRVDEEPLLRIVLLCTRDGRYHRLILQPGQARVEQVRLEYRGRARQPLLHELHVTRTPHLTVVFDLDETLVYNAQAGGGPALLRHDVIRVLRDLRQIAGVEIILWTASTRETGQPVVMQLEEDGIIFDHTIFRDERWFQHAVQRPYVKDLDLLGRDMNRVVMIENTPASVRLHPNNAIIVEDFVGQTGNDRTLLNLLRVLEELHGRVHRGDSVQDILGNRSDRMRPLLTERTFHLSQEWQDAVDSRDDIHPHQIPVHGTFVQVLSKQNETTAPAASNPTPQASGE